jgi:hypothetical protein
MDIQIKYKEVDKKAKVHNTLLQVAVLPMPGKIANAVNYIDKLYKEDGKEIESVTIPDLFNMEDHIFKATIVNGKNKDYAFMSMPAVLKLDKGCMSEFIDALLKIFNQMK